MDGWRVGWDGGTTYGAIGVLSLSNELGELNHVALKARLDKRHLEESEGRGGIGGREGGGERERGWESAC